MIYSSGNNSSNINSRELHALFSLLEDDDEKIFSAVQEKFRSLGPEVVPEIRRFADQLADGAVQSHALQIIRSFKEDALKKLLNLVIDAWANDMDINLEEAVALISKFGYPETKAEEISETLDRIALRVHEIFIHTKSPSDLTLLMSLNTAFFEEEKFDGASTEYYNPDNSYFITLLKSKKGIPISLSVAYMLVAERAGIDLYGIGMPLHFLVYHPALNTYIDAYNHGAFLTKLDCKNFIHESGFAYNETMLSKVSNVVIVTRMLRNLVYAHQKNGDKWEQNILQTTLDEIIRLTDAN